MNIAPVSMTAIHAVINHAKGAMKLAITPLREHIPIGRENAITRSDLAKLWKMDDRTVRETIAKMRITPTDDPLAILSSSTNPPGYWRSDVRAELERYIKEGQARAKNTIAALGDAKRVLDDAK